MKKVLSVPDMSCDHCKGRILKALETLPGISAAVDLKKKTVTVSMEQDVDDQTLRQLIEDAGYPVASIAQKKGLFG